MVAEQIRLPLVGFATHEAVEVLETHTRGPLLERTGGTAVLEARRVVVLAEPRRGIAVVLEDLADGGVLQANDRVVTRIAGGEFADDTRTHGVVVAARDEGRAGRRAERRGVELGVAQAGLRNAIERGCRDHAAEGARHAIALVVRHDQQDVRGALGRHDPRRPPGRRLLGALLDHAAERRLPYGDLVPLDRGRGARRAWRAGDDLSGHRASRQGANEDGDRTNDDTGCCPRAFHPLVFLVLRCEMAKTAAFGTCPDGWRARQTCFRIVKKRREAHNCHRVSGGGGLPSQGPSGPGLGVAATAVIGCASSRCASSSRSASNALLSDDAIGSPLPRSTREGSRAAPLTRNS